MKSFSLLRSLFLRVMLCAFWLATLFVSQPLKAQMRASHSTDLPQIQITASESDGMWVLVLKADVADQSEAWLDLNGNGAFDSGEELKMHEWGGFIQKPRSTSSLTIYGKITSFKCTQNQLTSVDIRKNPQLKELKCDMNPGIKTLDVSQNGALTTLISGSCDLSELDVTNNKALQVLEVFNNKLKTLNVRENTALTKLACDQNELTALDLSQNKKLQNIICYDNKITSLSLVDMPGLKSAHLENNKLASITLKGLPLLDYLILNINNLEQLDLSECPALQRLGCGMNKLKSLDLSHAPKLEEVFLADNQLDDAAFTSLVKQLPSREKLDNGRLFVVNTLAVPSDKNYCSKENARLARSKNGMSTTSAMGKTKAQIPTTELPTQTPTALIKKK